MELVSTCFVGGIDVGSGRHTELGAEANDIEMDASARCQSSQG